FRGDCTTDGKELNGGEMKAGTKFEFSIVLDEATTTVDKGNEESGVVLTGEFTRASNSSRILTQLLDFELDSIEETTNVGVSKSKTGIDGNKHCETVFADDFGESNEIRLSFEEETLAPDSGLRTGA
ncbi:unnamed protein product, partial [Didymodactylos carnosus]